MQQVQQENTVKALSGVNASMWAGYMHSVAQTETVTSSNTFEYDKASGFYLDRSAGLYYDPNTTYFFTTDYKKYFIYDADEKKLCHVDSTGKKVPGGERRSLPSQMMGQGSKSAPSSGAGRQQARSRSRSRGGGGGSGRQRSPTAKDRKSPWQEWIPTARGLKGDEEKEGKPIFFPGGDPLAKLAPAPAQASAATEKKKRKKEAVAGLAEMPNVTAAPGPVRSRVIPGPVTVFRGAPVPAPAPVCAFWPGRATPASVPSPAAPSQDALAAAHQPAFAIPVLPASVRENMAVVSGGEWICEICMRKFNSQEGLQRHEQLSDLHKQNLAKLAAIS